MQRKKYSYSESTVESVAEADKDSVKKTENPLIWFVITLLLLAVFAIGAVVYTVTETIDKGNCTAVGGVMIQQGSLWVCVDPNHPEQKDMR